MIVTTATGLTYHAVVDAGACEEPYDFSSVPARYCGAPAERLSVVDLPSGRRPERRCYCIEHGGPERARRELAREWTVAAPASVGADEHVLAAGCRQLQTSEAYVVLRQLPEAQGGRWLAWLGLGSLLHPVENPAIDPTRNKRGNVRQPRPDGRPLRSRPGLYAFASRDEALVTALARWRARVAATTAEITEARGGTLAWGAEIVPLAEPHVIELHHGEGTAWDVAAELRRVAPEGMSVFSGLRASGEAA